MLLAVLLVGILYSGHAADTGARNATSCDFFTGEWVKDEAFPIYASGMCPFIAKEFNCLKNGRPDTDYLKYRWKPAGCDLASFNGTDMLQRYRGKGILFSGDSLSRDQYMSFACLLYSSQPGMTYNYTINKDKVSTLTFLDYDIRVTMDRNPFLVDLVPSKYGNLLRLDSVAQKAKLWINNDLMVFNTGHWWSYRSAHQVWKYIQIGGRLFRDMDRMLAMEMALTTWAKWVDQNVDQTKATVFYQGISPSHYSGKEWNAPAIKNCAGVKQPLLGPTYPAPPPSALAVQWKVVSDMSVPAKFLDVTKLSQMRIDAHPSYYGVGGSSSDCTHWCVAGVPDTWNQLLYNIILENRV